MSDESVIIVAQRCSLHYLYHQKKFLLEEGELQILCLQGKNWIKLNQFMQNASTVMLMSLTFENSSSYLFHGEDGRLLALSFEKQLVPKANLIICNYCSVVDFKTNAKTDAVRQITTHYSDFTEQICVKHDLGFQLGKMFGKISSKIRKPSQHFSKSVNSKVSQTYRQSDGLANKWTSLKAQISQKNNQLSKLVSPIIIGVKKVANSIGQSFNHSQKSLIKKTRQFVKETAHSINKGYSSGQGFIKKSSRPNSSIELTESNRESSKHIQAEKKTIQDSIETPLV